ncbi:MAG: uncharacterized protein KVP18_002826 [Porospora cf. gigantea A]|uniref:uncharacterized protein n=2 Tax=Porospora cf. gigantea A TaxID=2853593 RepID=UPI00355A9B4D|nr:MAG: hypothetical protein KVP18_002826 [Porospora cf. gigantea A]
MRVYLLLVTAGGWPVTTASPARLTEVEIPPQSLRSKAKGLLFPSSGLQLPDVEDVAEHLRKQRPPASHKLLKKRLSNAWESFRRKATPAPETTAPPAPTPAAKVHIWSSTTTPEPSLKPAQAPFDLALVPEVVLRMDCNPGERFHFCVQECLQRRKPEESLLQECALDCRDQYISNPGEGCIDAQGNFLGGVREEARDAEVESLRKQLGLLWYRTRRNSVVSLFASLVMYLSVLVPTAFGVYRYKLHEWCFLLLNEDEQLESRLPPQAALAVSTLREGGRWAQVFCFGAGSTLLVWIAAAYRTVAAMFTSVEDAHPLEEQLRYRSSYNADYVPLATNLEVRQENSQGQQESSQENTVSS